MTIPLSLDQQKLASAVALLIYVLVYSFAYERGAKENYGYIVCKDGHLTMKNFLIESVRSEAFHFGVDPCNEHPEHPAAIEMDSKP